MRRPSQNLPVDGGLKTKDCPLGGGRRKPRPEVSSPVSELESPKLKTAAKLGEIGKEPARRG